MPRLRTTRPRRVRSRLTADQVADLLYGANPFGGPEGAFSSVEARRLAWAMHRSALLEVWSELTDRPTGHEHPAALIDYEQPELAYPPARKIRGLRIVTRDQRTPIATRRFR